MDFHTVNVPGGVVAFFILFRFCNNYQFSIVVEARYIKLIIETDGKMYLMNHCGNAVGSSLKISLACNFMED